MPEISLTDAQYEQLEAIRADVEDAFVDTYGHARLEDAVDYLLDTYTPPDERDTVVVAEGFDRIATAGYPELQRIAAEVPDIPGSGIDADEMRGKLLSELGPVELADRLADGAPDESVDSDEDTAESAAAETAEEVDVDAPADSAEEAADDETADADDTDDEMADADDSDDESASDTPSSSGPVDPLAGPGNALSAVNKLLREHDDKWRKTETGDEPYEVDLPDGTTEGVRTKDDVRQYLFRHY